MCIAGIAAKAVFICAAGFCMANCSLFAGHNVHFIAAPFAKSGDRVRKHVTGGRLAQKRAAAKTWALALLRYFARNRPRPIFCRQSRAFYQIGLGTL